MEPIRPISRSEPEVRPVQGTESRVKREDREQADRRERERRERDQRERATSEQQPPVPGEDEGGHVDVRV
jgi:hypothetical protein